MKHVRCGMRIASRVSGAYMFFSLLFATFAIALVVSVMVVKAFSRPVRSILDRIVDDSISGAWHRYITFAALVVGVSGGVRIYSLERYIQPETGPEGQVEPLVLNAERWTLEIYRTIIECLQSMAWMYLVVFLFALIAYVIVRIAERRRRD
jgi:hypothetical protein